MIRKIEPLSPAEQAGLMPGDRILEINDENVEDIEYFTLVNTLRDSIKKHNVINLLVRNSVEYNVYKNNNIPIINGEIPFMFKLLIFEFINNYIFRKIIQCSGTIIKYHFTSNNFRNRKHRTENYKIRNSK